MKYIYLDNAATTKIDDVVLKKMLPYFTENYGNPSSQYSLGRTARKAINESRSIVAKSINAQCNEVFFTSSGTESDNQAIKTIAMANTSIGKKIICSAIEHPAVLNSCKYLEKMGFNFDIIPVDSDGIIKLEVLEKMIDTGTVLVSVMMANNEVGTIQPIKKISEICHKYNVIFHTDAVQAIGNNNIDVMEMGIDALSMSAHKFYGPKGVGAIYIKNGIILEQFIHGGSQEKGLRASTENVAGIVGLGKAIEIATQKLKEPSKVKELRDYLLNRLFAEITDIKLNGSMEYRLNNNINLYIKGVSSALLATKLDMNNICISGGSACNSGSLKPSRVIMAMHNNDEIARSSVRISLGKYNIQEEMDIFINSIKQVIKEIRA